MTPNELITAIENGAWVTIQGANAAHLPWQIDPYEYLDFAQSDIKDRGRRGVVNALSNAKRALECQLDSILFAYGLTRRKKKRLNVPEKLAILQELGVIAPRILSKLNQHRNELEHEYTCPDPETVEDFVDVVALFLEATRNHIEERVCDWDIEIRGAQISYFVVEMSPVGLKLGVPRPSGGIPAMWYDEVKSGTKEHFDLLKALMRSVK